MLESLMDTYFFQLKPNTFIYVKISLIKFMYMHIYAFTQCKYQLILYHHFYTYICTYVYILLCIVVVLIINYICIWRFKYICVPFLCIYGCFYDIKVTLIKAFLMSFLFIIIFMIQIVCVCAYIDRSVSMRI